MSKKHVRPGHHRQLPLRDAGACGPCRFGTYVTEYRKALRDAASTGFRVLLFQQQGGLKQATGGGEAWHRPHARVLRHRWCRRSWPATLNAIGYRIRPYEVSRAPPTGARRGVQGHRRGASRSRTNILWRSSRRAASCARSVKVDR